jgi:hypothetical protein
VDTRALNVFLSVADTLNFSRSGELLHMSVSAVSRAPAVSSANTPGTRWPSGNSCGASWAAMRNWPGR